MKNTVFHSKQLATNFTLVAVLSNDGPYIEDSKGINGVALGAASLRYFENKEGRTGWFIVKHDYEPRVFLGKLTPEALNEISLEFGLPIERGNPIRMFYTSTAFQGLKSFAKTSPLITKRYAKSQEYLPGWYQEAMSEQATVH